MTIKERINEVLESKKSKYSLALFNNFSVLDVTDDEILEIIDDNFNDEDIDTNGLLSFRKGDAVIEIIPVSNLLKINIFDYENYSRSEEKLLHLKKI